MNVCLINAISKFVISFIFIIATICFIYMGEQYDNMNKVYSELVEYNKLKLEYDTTSTYNKLKIYEKIMHYTDSINKQK